MSKQIVSNKKNKNKQIVGNKRNKSKQIVGNKRNKNKQIVGNKKNKNKQIVDTQNNNNRQLVGNIGLFYICYELSKREWNCLPTTRNAKGIDILIYSQDGKKKFTIQTKSLSGKNPVPFGSKPNLMADFVIICRNVHEEKPEVFILTNRMIKRRLTPRKGNKESYWLEIEKYEKNKNKWNIIEQKKM